ncbi:MAG: cyclic nucleotide-binding/CBS domain-containing protein [Nitrospirales bacterium]|nr:CBS domain-containing protein [Nitrospirales bacterium]
METRTASKSDRDGALDKDITRLRQQVNVLKNFLLSEPSAEVLLAFDSAMEDILEDVFGSSSPLLATYEYAQVGEAAGLMNLPDTGTEETASNSQRETIRQRQRVLESGITELETRRAALSQEPRKGHAKGPRVSEYMTKSLRAVSMDTTLREVGQNMQKWKIGSVLVQSGDEYVGYITETELAREVVGAGMDPVTTTVKTCMREPIISLETSDALVEAVLLMKEKATRHLAVAESGKLVGVISVSDILRYYSGVK